jgi:hypothetical protein
MAGNLEFIKSETITSAVNSVSIGSTSEKLFTTDYDVYYITGGLVGTSTTANDIWLRVIDSSGAIDSGGGVYNWAGLRLNSDAGFNEVRSTFTGYINEMFGVIDDDPENQGFSTYVYNPANSSTYTFFQAQSSSAANGFMRGTKAIGVHTIAEEIIGINLLSSSSDTFTGKISVYGLASN